MRPQLRDRQRDARAYLFHEVREKQPARMLRCLLQTAILDRFCLPLCDALCPAGDAFQSV
ncbi:MAG: hypothetical protein IH608_04500 [Proteobacteria bacterium]|nr:hypothetical protein [Pseudomonadota bacterium]